MAGIVLVHELMERFGDSDEFANAITFRHFQQEDDIFALISVMKVPKAFDPKFLQMSELISSCSLGPLEVSSGFITRRQISGIDNDTLVEHYFILNHAYKSFSKLVSSTLSQTLQKSPHKLL